jgi:hypothetical protein
MVLAEAQSRHDRRNPVVVKNISHMCNVGQIIFLIKLWPSSQILDLIKLGNKHIQ